ncbi:MAG: glycosyltransferase [Sediminibacterium sp.]
MLNLSIVTICYNNFEDVKMTCASIDNQSVLPYEHWIINGSSYPTIAQWLEEQPQPNYRKWVNVTNKGIAGNFNEGIARATGTYIHLLNSGDIYASDQVIDNVVSFLTKNTNSNWVSGNIILHRGGNWITIGKPFDKFQVFKGMRSICHPSWFVKKEVYDRLGIYKNYSIAMDYDMMCRIKDEPYAYLNYTITKFDNTGVSTIKYLDSLKQNIEVYEANFGYSIKSRFWQFRLKLLHYLMQTNLGKRLFQIKENWL